MNLTRAPRFLASCLVLSGALTGCAEPLDEETSDVAEVAESLVATNLSVYPANSTVHVTYDHMSGSPTDWVAIAQAGSPDNTYVQMMYTGGDGVGAATGTKSFYGIAPGTYQARAYFNGSYMVQYRSPTFTVSCPAGQTLCGSSCTDMMSDAAHCGSCATACGAGLVCWSGTCGVAGDTRAAAIPVPLSGPSTTMTVDTTSAAHDTKGPCPCSYGHDVFFKFSLSAPEIVYADTIGTTWDTALFFQDTWGQNITAPGNGAAYNDDGTACGLGVQSQVALRLDPGTYYLVLSGCQSGPATVHFQHLPVGSGSLTYLPPGSARDISGTTSGTGILTSSCINSQGPENTYYWVTCPSSPGGTFWANSCIATSWDTVLDQRSATRPAFAVCNDDTTTCGTGRQSSVQSTIPAGAGLHTLFVDGYSPSSMGGYTLLYTRP